MDSFFADEIRWLFGNDHPPKKVLDVWKWWELRRLFYNAAIFVSIIFSYTACNFLLIGLYKDDVCYEPLAIMAAMTIGPILWNLGYTLGTIVDALFFKLHSKWLGPRLFKSGVALSIFLCFLPAMLILLFKFTPAAHAESHERVFDLMAKSKYNAALSLLQKDQSRLDAEGEYLEGYCLMRTHQMAEAKPHFQKSVQLGYAPYSGWTPTKSFLDRIDRFEHLRPVKQPNAYIEIYAANSNWTNPILKELPKFSERARFIFGNVPKITFYILAQRSDFSTFFATCSRLQQSIAGGITAQASAM